MDLSHLKNGRLPVRVVRGMALALLLSLVASLAAISAQAATPSAGTLSDNSV